VKRPGYGHRVKQPPTMISMVTSMVTWSLVIFSQIDMFATSQNNQKYNKKTNIKQSRLLYSFMQLSHVSTTQALALLCTTYTTHTPTYTHTHSCKCNLNAMSHAKRHHITLSSIDRNLENAMLKFIEILTILP